MNFSAFFVWTFATAVHTRSVQSWGALRCSGIPYHWHFKVRRPL